MQRIEKQKSTESVLFSNVKDVKMINLENKRVLSSQKINNQYDVFDMKNIFCDVNYENISETIIFSEFNTKNASNLNTFSNLNISQKSKTPNTSFAEESSVSKSWVDFSELNPKSFLSESFPIASVNGDELQMEISSLIDDSFKSGNFSKMQS